MTKKRTYKTLFRGIKWEMGYMSDLPWKEVYVDGDSLVFLYIRRFIDNHMDRRFMLEIIGSRIHGLQKAMNNVVIPTVAGYVTSMISTVIKNLEINKYNYVLVFGRGTIEEKNELSMEREDEKHKRYETLANVFGKKKCLHPGALISKGSVRSCIINCLMYLRDEIRDISKVMIKDIHDISYIEDIEPDIYCPRHCPVVITEDFDHILFGARTLMKEINQETFIYINVESVLEQISLDRIDIETLIKASVICGTDYNGGVPGMGPVKSIRMALNNPEDPLIDKRMVKFFLDKHGDILWKTPI